METLRLGRHGPEISRLGLGCMAMSDSRGLGLEDDAIATIHAAVDAGVTLLDTGDFYGTGGHNELLLHEALWSVRRDRLFISVNFGVQRSPDGALLGIDARPASVKNFVTYSLRRLGTDYIDLYQPVRTDPTVPIEDTIGAIADLVQAGYVRHIGLAQVSAETIRRAHAVHPIAAVQAEYSLPNRGAERQILPTLRELGIGLVAHGVLSRGLFGSHVPSDADDADRSSPAVDSQRVANELALLAVLERIADERDVTPARLAIAWALAQGDDIVPLIGPRRPEELADALGALAIALSSDDLARIESVVPARFAGAEGFPAVPSTLLDCRPSPMGR